MKRSGMEKSIEVVSIDLSATVEMTIKRLGMKRAMVCVLTDHMALVKHDFIY